MTVETPTATTISTVLDHLIEALRRAGTYNRNDQCPTTVVLWPDEGRSWETAVPQLLRRGLPLIVLGDYAPLDHRGPACWVRCVLAGRIPQLTLPGDIVPIIYLPGYGRHHLRAVEECPTDIRAIAELQFRGSWFSQGSGRDWTPLAFLMNKEHGVGLDVLNGTATTEAVQATLARLVDEPVTRLAERMPLSAADFYELSEADVVGSVLRWMDDPADFRATHADWVSFRQLCKKKLGLDPEEDTVIGAAQRLGSREGNWVHAWARFAEAPTNYPNLPELLRVARPAPTVQPQLFGLQSEAIWPQDNEDAEAELRRELLHIADRPVEMIRKRIADLELEHGARRSSVWAKLDRAPLASALLHLARLAMTTASVITGATVDAIVAAYSTSGWQADDSLVRALGAIDSGEDCAAVASVAAGLYRPWAEAGVTNLLSAFIADTPTRPVATPISTGTCRLFTDGLRFDLGQRLAEELRRRDLIVVIEPTLAPIPTVTATAKPALAPVGQVLVAGDGVGLKIADTGSTLTADGLRRLLASEGIQTLASHEVGDPTGRGWTELGDVDSLGHAQGARLPRYIDDQIRAIADRVTSLLKAGWANVEVVTDHGWILDPLGLDKVAPMLPEALTVVRKGRCARVKDHAAVDFPTLPWHWDSSVQIAIAPGLRAFEAGKSYEHGGVSPQESVTPRLTVRLGSASVAICIAEVRWVGLRCRVRVDDASDGVAIDIRINPAQPDTSIAVRMAELDRDGNASLLVASDEHEGNAAVVVVVASDGAVLGQQPTIVGES